MTREEALQAYRPIRASLQGVLREAPNSCSQADFRRAAKALGLWREGMINAGDETEMVRIADIALFEPNPRGSRAIDRFVRQHRRHLPPGEAALAARMAQAHFSVFRVTGRHESAGLWLEDLLAGPVPVWLMDEALEGAVAAGTVLAMRLFDAGPFHAGFGTAVALDAADAEMIETLRRQFGDLPFEGRFAQMVYGCDIHGVSLSRLTAVTAIHGLLDRGELDADELLDLMRDGEPDADLLQGLLDGLAIRDRKAAGAA